MQATAVLSPTAKRYGLASTNINTVEGSQSCLRDTQLAVKKDRFIRDVLLDFRSICTAPLAQLYLQNIQD